MTGIADFMTPRKSTCRMIIITGRDHKKLVNIRVARGRLDRSHDWGGLDARLVHKLDEVGSPGGEPCGEGVLANWVVEKRVDGVGRGV